MATTRTELELATNVLLHFNIIAAEESPSASDSTYVIGRYRDLFNEMTLNDETYWNIGQVPADGVEPGGGDGVVKQQGHACQRDGGGAPDSCPLRPRARGRIMGFSRKNA